MAATINNTLVKIGDTVTVGSGGASSIDFTSIPQTYTDLLLKVSARSVGSTGEIRLEFNGVTTGYSGRYIQGNGSTATSGVEGATHSLYLGENAYSTYTSNVFTSGEFYIPNYTSSNYKSVSGYNTAETNGGQAFSHLSGHLWSNTAAITSIKIKAAANNFAQYTTATLYGITATPNTTKASGGIIYQDATYMYHVFPYTSTFTPSVTLSCDVLSIAGGGAGGAAYGGGGGAGGLVYASSQSLSAMGYTVTVGAGGAGASMTGGGSSAGPGQGGSGTNSQFGALTAASGGGGGGRYYDSNDVQTTRNGVNGGSGGGGGAGTNGSYVGSGGTGSQGNSGGSGTAYYQYSPNGYRGGGGGGAGGGGATWSSNSSLQLGGVGSSTYSSWVIATNYGQIISGTGYIAGGGGGADNNAGLTISGGSGGGGQGGSGASGVAGTSNTGGGGGGSGAGGTSAGANGGSGVIIIRYAK